MKKFYNPQPEFGDGGPFEAETREQLANEMMVTFEIWSREKYQKMDRFDRDEIDYEGFVSECVDDMRCRFIAGLEEITEDNN